MPNLDRRDLLRATLALGITPACLPVICGWEQPGGALTIDESSAIGEQNEKTVETEPVKKDTVMQVHYLEIVTPEADTMCTQYSVVYGVTFSDPDPNLGGARTTKLAGGGMMGIRGPLRETETPVVRPYMLVEDIAASVAAAAKAGAKIALPPMKLPGHGTCAIVIQGGIDCGLWQL